jgi:hypothetical protein
MSANGDEPQLGGERATPITGREPELSGLRPKPPAVGDWVAFWHFVESSPPLPYARALCRIYGRVISIHQLEQWYLAVGGYLPTDVRLLLADGDLIVATDQERYGIPKDAVYIIPPEDLEVVPEETITP